MVAGFIGTILDASPVFASTAESFLTIERANVLTNDDDDFTIELTVEGLLIPTNGTEGTFGYGVLMDEGNTILVTHTHPGYWTAKLRASSRIQSGITIL